MGIIARWSFIAKFGRKSESINHLKRWIDEIGSQAGCTINNTQIITGSVGILESQVEMNVALDSLTSLDEFFNKIPGKEHVEWGKEMSEYITDGSTRWDVFRIKEFDSDKWTCGACTMANEESALKCSTCTTKRPASAMVEGNPPDECDLSSDINLARDAEVAHEERR